MANVCIVGSINMDLTVTTTVVPQQGETVLGESYATYPGGKGANQAVAAARLGANVTMIAAVGDDDFGKALLARLKSEGICTEGVSELPSVATGIANIILSENDNRIIVAPGANKYVTPEMIEQNRDLILNSDVVVLQLEIPIESVIHTVKLAKDNDVKVILNPAPYMQLPEELLLGATYITPNEIEASGMKENALFATIQDKLIVTIGEKGVQLTDKIGNKQIIPGYNVEVQDTTGAGDTFNGALAVQLAENVALADAILFANAAAALSVTAIGAQNGMPRRTKVERFMKET